MKSGGIKSCTAALVALLITGCNQERRATGNDVVDGQGANAAASGRVAAAEAPTTVSIRFFGTISHLFHKDDNRAVLLRRSHTGTLTVKAGITEAALKAAWPAGDVKQNDGGEFTVPLEGWALRFTSKGTPIAQPSTIERESSFVESVPSLKAITDSDDMPQKNFETLNSEVTIDGPPAPNNRISSWIQLPGGTFTADYNKWTGKFDPDHQAKGERLFGEWITLTTVIQTPTLQVSKEKDKWIDIPLDAGGVVLTVENNPPPNKPGDLQTHHFHMHYDLAGVPINDAPHRPRIRKLRNRLTVADAGLMNFINDVIDRSPGSDASQREKKLVDVLVTDVPGCSNSTWP